MNWRRERESANLALAILGILLVALLFGTFIDSHYVPLRAAGGQPITRTFQPSSADSYVDQFNPTTNYGSSTTLSVNTRASRNTRALVQFTIAAIPANSVSSATMQLYLTTAPAASRTHNAHLITQSWTEAGVTWDTYDGTNNWTTAGGDFSGTATASTTTGTTSGVTLSWTVTSDVQAYVNGTATNYGWLVKDQTESATPNRTSAYASKEYATPANRPLLSVTFTAPWDSYSDSGRTTISDTFNGDTTTRVYMKGTGFANGYYNVGYYDKNGTYVFTQSNVQVTDGSTLLPGGDLGFLLSYDPTAQGNGDWHALVQPASGYTSFGTATYSTITADPNTYGLMANDAFYVANSAIPEFPTAMAGIMVAGLCFGIYWWMRKRAKFKMQRAK